MDAEEIHRKASEQFAIVKQINQSVQSRQIDETIQEKVQLAVRFYGLHLMQLPESNEAVLMLAGIFINTSENKLIKWHIKDTNLFLQLISKLLLVRRDESLMRKACNVLVEFVSKMDEAQLKKLAGIHSKSLMLILKKMSKVSTVYTQMKLLKVLHVICRVLDDGGTKNIRQSRIVQKSETSAVDDLVGYFEGLHKEHFVETSYDFLGQFNAVICPSQFIFSIDGYLMQFNKQKSSVRTIVDFNLRNLSISFFINAIVIDKQKKTEEVYFVELEECEVVTASRRFKDPNHIELTVKPGRYQILDQNDNKVLEDPIESVVLVVADTDKHFSDVVKARFEEKRPMIVDMTDQESVVSFRTAIVATPQKLLTTPAARLRTAIDLTQEFRGSQYKESQQLKSSSEPAIEQDVEAFSQMPPKEPLIEQATQRRMAKVAPQTQQNKTFNELLPHPSKRDYDDLSDENARMPPFSRYIGQARRKRKGKDIQDEIVQPSQSAVTGKSAPVKAHKAPPKKANQKKTPAAVKKEQRQVKVAKHIDYSTDEAEEMEQPETPPKKQKLTLKKRQAPKKRSTSSEDEFILSNLKSENPKKSYFSKGRGQTKAAPKKVARQQVTKPVLKEVEKPSISVQKAVEKPPSPRKIVDHHDSLQLIRNIKRRNEDEVPVDPKKSRYNFDDILSDTDKKLPNKEVEKPAHRVTFDEVKKTKPASPAKKMTFTLESVVRTLSSDHESAVEIVAEAARIVQQPGQSPVVYNYDTLRNNEILGKFLSDSSNQRDGLDELDADIEEFTYTQTIRKRKSPSSKVDERSRPPPRKMPENESLLEQMFLERAKQEIDSARDEMQKLQVPMDLDPAIQLNIERTCANYRTTADRYKSNVQEHLKLLKRLHHSKRNLMQIQDQLLENIHDLRSAVKDKITFTRNDCKERMQKAEELQENLQEKEKLIKQVVWREYISNICQTIANQQAQF